MIRKITAMFFILLANIVLLVHAVVPHHHHKSLVCIEGNTCQSDNCTHDHCTSTHEHDGSAGTENCELRQVLAIPGSSVKQEIKCLGCDNNHSTFVHFQAVLIKNEFNSFVPEIIIIAQIALKISPHSNFVSASLGLRAPPVA
jgi:hypothetical protein